MSSAFRPNAKPHEHLGATILLSSHILPFNLLAPLVPEDVREEGVLKVRVFEDIWMDVIV